MGKSKKKAKKAGRKLSKKVDSVAEVVDGAIMGDDATYAKLGRKAYLNTPKPMRKQIWKRLSWRQKIRVTWWAIREA